MHCVHSTDIWAPNLTAEKNTIHQVTTMLATCKNIPFPGHKHLLTTGADDPTLIIARVPVRVIIKVKGHQHSGYDLEMGLFWSG